MYTNTHTRTLQRPFSKKWGGGAADPDLEKFEGAGVKLTVESGGLAQGGRG